MRERGGRGGGMDGGMEGERERMILMCVPQLRD